MLNSTSSGVGDAAWWQRQTCWMRRGTALVSERSAEEVIAKKQKARKERGKEKETVGRDSRGVAHTSIHSVRIA
jgi:hypothetical protein